MLLLRGFACFPAGKGRLFAAQAPPRGGGGEGGTISEGYGSAVSSKQYKWIL